MTAEFDSMLDAMSSGETLVFGHRGAMANAPMNTMSAFELALQQGAGGIELDVHRSLDGHVFVMHDFTVNETTNGCGAIRDLSLAELQALDAGSWFSGEYEGERIPTLDEVFELLGRRTLFDVEIKVDPEFPDDIVQVVVDCISRHRMQNRVIISSFDPHVLLSVQRLMPEVMIGFLYVPAMPAQFIKPLTQLKHDARHPWHDMVDSKYMTWARANSYFVNVWTVNDPKRALHLKSLGVNGIITDQPDLLVNAFAKC